MCKSNCPYLQNMKPLRIWMFCPFSEAILLSNLYKFHRQTLSPLTEMKRLSNRFVRNRKHMRQTGCKIRWNIQVTLRLSATPSSTSENGGGLHHHKSAYQHINTWHKTYGGDKAALRVNHSFHNWETRKGRNLAQAYALLSLLGCICATNAPG